MTEAVVASPGGETGITGGEGQSWQEQYLAGEEFAELRDNESIKTIPDVPTLAKVWIDTKGMVGRKGVIIPKEDATPEDWDRFHTELGRPPTPEAYEISPVGLPEDFPYLPELEISYRQLAYQAGLSPAQAKLIFDGYNKFVLEKNEEDRQTLKVAVAEIEASLQKEWGNKYTENIALARSTAAKVAPAGSAELQALDTAIGESPVLVKFFYNLGKSMSEGSFITGSGSTGGADMESRRQELMRKPAYMDEKHADHKTIVAQVIKIYEELHPEPKEQ